MTSTHTTPGSGPDHPAETVATSTKRSGSAITDHDAKHEQIQEHVNTVKHLYWPCEPEEIRSQTWTMLLDLTWLLSQDLGQEHNERVDDMVRRAHQVIGSHQDFEETRSAHRYMLIVADHTRIANLLWSLRRAEMAGERATRP
ncbi:hypothetical protein GCM10010252_14760 [Streptomyces aureoverticillatus]|nr:hypothetical protein GCM10010252_14760 [Streptomyces aureoverticillatus]